MTTIIERIAGRTVAGAFVDVEEPRGDLAGGGAPFQSRTKIVQFGLKPVEPLLLLAGQREIHRTLLA